MNRHKQQTPEKPKQKPNLKQEKEKTMKTKQSVTNSNNHQPSTACREKHAAMKLPIRSTIIAAFGVLAMLLPAHQAAHAQGTTSDDFVAPIVFQAAGPKAASLEGAVDAYRRALGDPNNLSNPGPLASGRREINWDGGNPGIMTTTPPVTPFNTFLNTRGAQFTTPGIGLSQATPSGLAVLFGNATYSSIFSTFSPSRLFTPVGSNITESLFFIPGTSPTGTPGTPAAVRGFGAVFTDVHAPGRTGATTSVEYFDANGDLLFSGFVPPSPHANGLSFFGIVFPDARIARVQITSGNVAPGPNDDRHHDIVVMDDFIYGEPQPLQ
jgi:hypothetical protein